jgi:hypothetical protein
MLRQETVMDDVALGLQRRIRMVLVYAGPPTFGKMDTGATSPFVGSFDPLMVRDER